MAEEIRGNESSWKVRRKREVHLEGGQGESLKKGKESGGDLRFSNP